MRTSRRLALDPPLSAWHTSFRIPPADGRGNDSKSRGSSGLGKFQRPVTDGRIRPRSGDERVHLIEER